MNKDDKMRMHYGLLETIIDCVDAYCSLQDCCLFLQGLLLMQGPRSVCETQQLKPECKKNNNCPAFSSIFLKTSFGDIATFIGQ